ncbi:MAG: DUF2934 domain-containing protein [Fibrobacter sp.]|nr:DUF2934 domain-containing protein [Fibrobacter sp.]
MESVHELIARRAYELFLARGGENGYAIQDWVAAEKEILAQVDKERREVAKEKAEKARPAAAQAAPAPAPKVEAVKASTKSAPVEIKKAPAKKVLK